MFQLDFVSSRSLLGTAVLLVAVLSGLVVWRKRRRKTPADIERQRCRWLYEIGRFSTGEIVDVLESTLAAGSQRVVVYHYAIGGVDYEASQDISALGSVIDDTSCRPGYSVNIKYDPNNPGNSILACDTWSGVTAKAPAPLRTSAIQ